MNVRPDINVLEQHRKLHQQQRNEQKEEFYLNSYLKGSITTCDRHFLDDLDREQKKKLRNDLNFIDEVYERELRELEGTAMECE